MSATPRTIRWETNSGRRRGDVRELAGERHNQRGEVLRYEAFVVRRIAMEHFLHSRDFGRRLRRSNALMPHDEHRYVTAHLARGSHGIRDTGFQLLPIVLCYH